MIADLFDQLDIPGMFSKIDQRLGYHLLVMKEEDAMKCASGQDSTF